MNGPKRCPYLTRVLLAFEKMPPMPGTVVRVRVSHSPTCPLPGGKGCCTCHGDYPKLEYHYYPAARAKGRGA